MASICITISFQYVLLLVSITRTICCGFKLRSSMTGQPTLKDIFMRWHSTRIWWVEELSWIEISISLHAVQWFIFTSQSTVWFVNRRANYASISHPVPLVIMTVEWKSPKSPAYLSYKDRMAILKKFIISDLTNKNFLLGIAMMWLIIYHFAVFNYRT